MGIQPTNVNTSNSFIIESSRQRQTSAGAMTDFAASATGQADIVTISQAARDRAGEDSKVGSPYDFAKISPNEVLSTINNLVKSGKMSLDESSALLAFRPLTVQGYRTTASDNQPINLFSGLENMIAYNKSIRNDAAVVYAQKAYAALERLQGTAR